MYKKALEEFHKALFLKTGDYRQDINQRFLAGNPTTDLRASLIQEETQELCEALKSGSLEEVRKELCDVLYVVFAVAALYDLPVEEDFKLVHENNMLKFATGFLGPNGKWMKAKDHPKVKLTSRKVDTTGQFELPIPEVPDCVVP